MFGLIFHWGVYSVTAYDDPISARRRKMQNGSEWYLKRLIEKGDYRPISGWKETQEYHDFEFPGWEYEDLAELFNKDDVWNPDDWMKLAKEVGATYVILTARHHEGFCLWPTKTTTFQSRVDCIKLFLESAKRANLKAGLYYSWSEFGKSVTKDYVDTIIVPQMKELKTYKSDILWFDGHWDIKTQYAKNKIIDIIHELKPKGVEINDRIFKDSVWDDQNYLGEASFRVYGDREIPSQKPLVPWEHINTIGLSWGRNVAQEEKDYKKPTDLLGLYNKVKSLGGKFLLNLGPDYDGSFDQKEVDSLRGFSQLMKL